MSTETAGWRRPILFLVCVSCAAAAPSQTAFEEAPWPFSFLAYGPFTLLADFNGDGRQDLLEAWTGYSTAANRISLSVAGGGYVTASPALPGFPGGVLIGAFDANGDGNTDVVVAAPGLPFQIRTFWGDGAGAFAGGPSSFPGGFLEQIRAAELTGDTITDLYGRGVGGLGVLTGDGAGGWSAVHPQVPPALPGLSAAAAADIDLDGDRDIVAGQPLAGLVVFLNDGTGVVAPRPPDPAAFWIGLAEVADVDGDGFVDVLTGDGLVVARNIGGGSFTPWTAGWWGGTLTDSSIRFVAGAFDADVRADVLLARFPVTAASPQPAGPLFLHAYGTASGFQQPGPVLDQPYGGTVVAGGGIRAADLDGDGDTDVLVDGPGQPGRALLNLRLGPHSGSAGSFGGGCPGFLAPRLSLTGTPAPGGAFSLVTTGGPPGALAYLVAGTVPGQRLLPPGCTLAVLDPAPIVIPHVLDGAGNGSVPFALPPGVPPAGLRACAQDILVSPLVFYGVTGTQGLILVF